MEPNERILFTSILSDDDITILSKEEFDKLENEAKIKILKRQWDRIEEAKNDLKESKYDADGTCYKSN